MQEAQLGAGKKVFDLALTDLGPYSVDFSRSGRHLLLGGRKGMSPTSFLPRRKFNLIIKSSLSVAGGCEIILSFIGILCRLRILRSVTSCTVGS